MLRMPFALSRRKRPKPVKKITLAGDRVVLREKRISDAQDDYSWRTDLELAELDASNPITMSYENFVKYSREEIDDPNPNSMRFGIDDVCGKHIGNTMFYDINMRRGAAELGIMIGDRDYWSKGYGTDAVAMMLDYIFTTTDIRRVYLHTLVWNRRAQRAFGKAGFRAVKNVNRSGYDFILMEILRAEWEQLPPPEYLVR